MAVVRAGGISAAARRLGRSQPTVSRQLSALEARLGVRLIERTTRRFRLTTAGRTYFERCEAAPRAAARGRRARRRHERRPARHAQRSRLPPTYARRRLAPLLPAFLAEPSRPPTGDGSLATERADLVAEHVDLVVRFGPLPDSTLAVPGALAGAVRPVRGAGVRPAARGFARAHRRPAARRCLVTETFGLREPVDIPAGAPAARRRRARECIVSDDLGLLHEAARAGVGLDRAAGISGRRRPRDRRARPVLPRRAPPQLSRLRRAPERPPRPPPRAGARRSSRVTSSLRPASPADAPRGPAYRAAPA